jgi:hypothetical protein
LDFFFVIILKRRASRGSQVQGVGKISRRRYIIGYSYGCDQSCVAAQERNRIRLAHAYLETKVDMEAHLAVIRETLLNLVCQTDLSRFLASTNKQIIRSVSAGK